MQAVGQSGRPPSMQERAFDNAIGAPEPDTHNRPQSKSRKRGLSSGSNTDFRNVIVPYFIDSSYFSGLSSTITSSPACGGTSNQTQFSGPVFPAASSPTT